MRSFRLNSLFKINSRAFADAFKNKTSETPFRNTQRANDTFNEDLNIRPAKAEEIRVDELKRGDKAEFANKKEKSASSANDLSDALHVSGDNMQPEAAKEALNKDRFPLSSRDGKKILDNKHTSTTHSGSNN